MAKYWILRAIKHLEDQSNSKWSRDMRDAITELECIAGGF